MVYNMSKVIHYVSDFFREDEGPGGACLSDYALMERLEKSLDVSFVKIRPSSMIPIDPKGTYIVANRSLFPRSYLEEIMKSNYVIFEHDHQYDGGSPRYPVGRNPYIYNQEGIVPDEFKKNLDFYENAKAVFLQTDFHKDIFERNNVPGNLISLETTIFSDSELELLRTVLANREIKQKDFCVLNSKVWLKGTAESLSFCESNGWSVKLLEGSDLRFEFLKNLSEYTTLVFTPLSPETCCRFVVEARMLGLNVITTYNYGAPLSKWFKLSGESLIKETEDIITKRAIPTIMEYLC